MHREWLRINGSRLALLIGPAAGLVWSSGRLLPTVVCASFAAALVVMAAAGLLVQSFVDGDVTFPPTRARPGIFQLLWLGQYAVFALALLITPFAAVFSQCTGKHIPLRFSLPAVVLVLFIWHVRKMRQASMAIWMGVPGSSWLAAAVVCIAVFRVVVLHSVHAGALGHDTQQHIFWTQHIADYGFLPLVSRGTDLLEPYPRLFHLLSATWAAAGFSSIVGPFVKIMPFVQAAWACGFLCELLMAMRGASEVPARSSLTALAMSVFLCWHLTFGDAAAAYPHSDLSGTPRLSAGWILFGLPLLVLAHRAGTFRDIRPWLLGLLPVFATAALGVNPVTSVVYLSYSVPFAAVLYACTPRRADAFVWQPALRRGCAVAAALLFTNPFVIDVLSRRPWVAAIFDRLAVRTDARGIDAASWIPNADEQVPMCAQGAFACLVTLVKNVFASFYEGVTNALSEARLPGVASVDDVHVYWLAFSVPLIVLAFLTVRRSSRARPHLDGARLFLDMLLASGVAACAIVATTAVLHALEGFGPLFGLLSGYYREVSSFLGPWVLCVVTLSGWSMVARRAQPVGRLAAVFALVVVAELFALGAFKPEGVVQHRHAREWKIDWPELRAIEHLNAFVPANETVVVPSRHWLRHHREHLLVADDPVGMIVPHLTTRFLFGVSIGASIDYSWADLSQTFCGRSPEMRQKLLRSVNARWVLARAKQPNSRATFEHVTWDCDVTMKDLRAEYPAAWTERDLALYRINP